MNKISEKTLIPLSLLSAIVGGVIWLTTIFDQGRANAQVISEIKDGIEELNEKIYIQLQSINTRLSRIEGKLSSEKGRE